MDTYEAYKVKIAELIGKNIDLRRDMDSLLRADEQKHAAIVRLLDEKHELEKELFRFKTD